MRCIAIFFYLLLCLKDSAVIGRYNRAYDWPGRCPQPCICRSSIAYCDGMRLQRVPRHMPNAVYTVYMRDNYIRRIPYRRLQGLYNLKHLMFKGNHITQIDQKAFYDLYSLISLSLTDNLISFLPKDLFAHQKNLQVLSIRNNKLRKVDYLFKNMTKLQLLNLGNNRIRYIKESFFKQLPAIRVLDLHGNRIKHLAAQGFAHLPNLRFLILRDNLFGSIEFDFGKNRHLELLDLTNCQLTSVIKKLPHTVSDLRLSENHITEIGQHDFANTKQIRLLVLNHNQIRKIHERALAGLQQLYDLYISKNRLTKIPSNLPKNIHGIYANYNNISNIMEGTFNYHNRMEFLFLRHNDIKEIEQTALHSLHNLRSMDISHNRLMGLKPYTFSRMRSLELLDLSKNPMVKLEYGCFHGLRKLTILQLSSVLTKSFIVPSTFRDMQNLRFLDLSNSATLAQNMAQNSFTFQPLSAVEDLNMMNDRLYTLPPDLPKHVPHIRVIKLIGNPWHCDYTILWLADWMRNRSVEFYAPQFMVCSSPPHMSGRQIRSLTTNDVRPPTARPPPPPTSGIRKISVPSLGVIFSVIDHPYKKKVKFFGRKVNYGGRQGLSRPLEIPPVETESNETQYSKNKQLTIKVTPIEATALPNTSPTESAMKLTNYSQVKGSDTNKHKPSPSPVKAPKQPTILVKASKSVRAQPGQDSQHNWGIMSADGQSWASNSQRRGSHSAENNSQRYNSQDSRKKIFGSEAEIEDEVSLLIGSLQESSRTESKPIYNDSSGYSIPDD